MSSTSKNAPLGVTGAKPGPADFPLGSVESRAAARAMADQREWQPTHPLPLGFEALASIENADELPKTESSRGKRS